MIFHLYKTFNCRRSLDVYRGNEHVRPCDYVHILLFVQLEVGFAIVEKSQAPCDTDSIGGWLFVDRLSISINMIIDIIGSIFTLTDTICIRILHLLGHLAVHRVQEQKEKALIDSGCEPVCISGLHIWWFLCENLLEEEEESIGSVRNICSWIFYYILLHGVVTSMASSIKPISVCVRVFLTYQKKNSYFFCDNFKANVYVMHCYLFSSAIMNDFVNFSNLFSHNINN